MSNDQTYLEAVKDGGIRYYGAGFIPTLKPINWFDELGVEETENGEFYLNNQEPADWNRLRVLSGQWVTCACGAQCAIIPRNTEGEPLDWELKQLGLAFHTAIDLENRSEAFDILMDIETRSIKLMNQINENLKTEEDYE